VRRRVSFCAMPFCYLVAVAGSEWFIQIDFSSELEFCKSKPIISSLKMPSTVTLSGSIGKGMLCPFPALSATADPLPAHLDGYPTAPGIFAQK
jgi:hypothetical protein